MASLSETLSYQQKHLTNDQSSGFNKKHSISILDDVKMALEFNDDASAHLKNELADEHHEASTLGGAPNLKSI